MTNFERIKNMTDKDVDELKKEIERLKSDIFVANQKFDAMKDRYDFEKDRAEKRKQKAIDAYKKLKTAKSEAYKEFANKLCEGKDSNDKTVIEAEVLLKEIVGEE